MPAPVLSTENLPTIVAVSFVLVLLSLALSFYNNGQVHEGFTRSGQLAVDVARRDDILRKDLERRVNELHQEVETLRRELQEARGDLRATADAR